MVRFVLYFALLCVPAGFFALRMKGGRRQAREEGREEGREGKGRTEGQGLEQRAAAMAHGLGL